jgi:hypothetical protein
MKLIRELRRREVFRTAGLYVGIAWILIEGASVLLDAFEAPDWILRASSSRGSSISRKVKSRFRPKPPTPSSYPSAVARETSSSSAFSVWR